MFVGRAKSLGSIRPSSWSHGVVSWIHDTNPFSKSSCHDVPPSRSLRTSRRCTVLNVSLVYALQILTEELNEWLLKSV